MTNTKNTSKHTDTIISGVDLYNAMCKRCDDDEMMELLELDPIINRDGLPECPVPTGYWLVSWPNYVITPDFDGDATYWHVADDIATAKKEYPQADFYNHY